MEDLFSSVVKGLPGAPHDRVMSPQLMLMLMAQPAAPSELCNNILNRLKTADEHGSTEMIGQLLNVCLSAPLQPDEVEQLVESLLTFVKDKMEWRDAARWVAALIHFHCTDEMTISIFAEFGAVEFATKLLELHHADAASVMAAVAVLHHFNCYPLCNTVQHLSAALGEHCDSHNVSLLVTKCIAEFTSYYGGNVEWMQRVCIDFIASAGVHNLEAVMNKHTEDETICIFSTRIVANLSAVEGDECDFSGVMDHVNRALKLYSARNDALAAHALYALGNFPESANVDLVTTILKGTRDENTIYESIRCLSSVATHVKESKPAIASGGTVPLVLKAMKQHSQHTGILEEGCNMLSYMAYDSSSITQHVTETGGIELMLHAMKEFNSNPGLVTAAAAALSGLSFNNPSGQQMMINGGAIPLLLASMRQMERARLHELCCLAFGTMCWNTDLKNQLVQNRGISIILDSLDKYKDCSGLVKNACRALAQIAFNSDDYRDDISKTSAARLVVDAMKLHPTHDRAQMHGCVALSYLNWTMPNPNRVVMDAFKVIIDAMKNHTLSSDVQEHACRALANIGGVLSAADSKIALEHIVDASRRHEKYADVQEEACRAMVTLSLQCPKNKDLLARLGAPERVMAALRNFPKSYSVQQEACNALAHLAYEHVELNGLITELGGVGALLTALRNHPANSRVQLTACGGLSALAFDNTTAQRQISDQGGVECVIWAMRHYPRLRIMELCCSVLGTLAWNTDIKESVAVVAIPEILNAMSAHQDSPLLQKATCRAISQFAFNSEKNRKILFDAGAVPLILRSMRQHIHADKLVGHALVALTYLCWENGAVAEAIVSEGSEDLLRSISKIYESHEKVFNKAAHLSKILARKSQSPSQRSPIPDKGVESPSMHSPVPLRDVQATPFHDDDDVCPMSPPTLERESGFYSAPQDTEREPTRLEEVKRQTKGKNREIPANVMPSYAEDLPEERKARQRHGDDRRGRGSRNTDREGDRGRRGGRGAAPAQVIRRDAPSAGQNPDDLWDTPTTFMPKTPLNWQQQQLQQESQQENNSNYNSQPNRSQGNSQGNNNYASRDFQSGPNASRDFRGGRGRGRGGRGGGRAGGSSAPGRRD